MDEIESIYPNFLKTHPRYISDSKVIIDKEMVDREMQNIKDYINSTINRDKNIKENLFNKILTKVNFARFTIKNILSRKQKRINKYCYKL